MLRDRFRSPSEIRAMVFNSLTFLAFFAVVFTIHHFSPLSWTLRKAHLLLASYLFYAAWNPPLVLLLMLTTGVDWGISILLARTASVPRRRMLFLASLAGNLGVLAFFKYGSFLLDNLAGACALAGIAWTPARPDIVLPVGISFYTFQTLSYVIDVYRGRIAPWTSLLDFALYVTFFPQLVAGPIVRAAEFRDQCSVPRRASGGQLGWGLSLIVLGLFFKSVLADGVLGGVSDRVFDSPIAPGAVDAWLATFSFSGQIYFDFAGYSTCAVGAALCLGFTLPDNFRSPYAAAGFSDFWRRWHVTLSTWLRDYLYIPLGGSRGRAPRTYANLLLTMLLGGLWHGASWTFVAWGGLHGVYLAVERWWRGDGEPVERPGASHRLLIRILGTYLMVCVAWVFFRSRSFERAFSMLKGMSGWRGEHFPVLIPVGEAALAACVVLLMIGVQCFTRGRTLQELAGRIPWPVRGGVLAVLMVLLVMASGGDRAFIYFQF